MAKVTSKLQVTIPKSLAEHFGIHSGDEIHWESAGEMIRVIPPGRDRPSSTERLRLFDAATKRQAARQQRLPLGERRRRELSAERRGWTREALWEESPQEARAED